jgi:hypothetical protein
MWDNRRCPRFSLESLRTYASVVFFLSTAHCTADPGPAAIRLGDFDYQIVQEPVDEKSINSSCAEVERLVRAAESPHQVKNRAKYITDFVSILRICDRSDRFRKLIRRGGETPVIDTNAAQVLQLSDRTAARLIRCLGDLSAESAVNTISEFLLLPKDFETGKGLPKTGDMPTSWALFQIGDGALPRLRSKMVDENKDVRYWAQYTALGILGPRSAYQLEVWLKESETDEQRNRLSEAAQWFTIMTENTRLLNPEQYREEHLRKGRDRVETLLRGREAMDRAIEERKKRYEQKKREQTTN